MALVLSEAMSGYGADDVVDDGHKHDLVMPGFRFHPTEEELIDFYLRRKIEGKRFNVELINFLDLYRYDPWELPALAAIGEKEWFFYVPRDRKYRNGDRPNRVTTSGYWKATGADRMIRNDSSRPIGLKKTLVFYLGKAPKGVRTSWIMNEYRLPQSDTDQLHKTEISLCRVYKRPGIEDVRRLPSKPSCSKRSVTEVSPPDSAYTSLVDDRTCPIPSMPTSTTPSMTNIEELNAVIGYDRSYIRHRSDQLPLLPLPSQPQTLALNTVSASSMTTDSNQIWEWCPLQETCNGYTSFK